MTVNPIIACGHCDYCVQGRDNLCANRTMIGMQRPGGFAERVREATARYGKRRIGVFRGGCLTGPNHTGVELHGFLSYLVKCNLEGREYRVFSYKGKQVRDNIHSHDVARFIHAFVQAPRPGEVYNLGGFGGWQSAGGQVERI